MVVRWCACWWCGNDEKRHTRVPHCTPPPGTPRFPLIDMFDGLALKRGILPSSLPWRLLLRSSCVLCIAAAAAALPFFGPILGFVGALCITPTTFLMPAALWLKLRQPSWRAWDFWFCVATLVVMGCVMVLGTAGALRDLERKVFHPPAGGRPPSFEW